MRARPSAEKRRKEAQRLERQRDKAERKKARRLERTLGTTSDVLHAGGAEHGEPSGPSDPAHLAMPMPPASQSPR